MGWVLLRSSTRKMYNAQLKNTNHIHIKILSSKPCSYFRTIIITERLKRKIACATFGMHLYTLSVALRHLKYNPKKHKLTMINKHKLHHLKNKTYNNEILSTKKL